MTFLPDIAKSWVNNCRNKNPFQLWDRPFAPIAMSFLSKVVLFSRPTPTFFNYSSLPKFWVFNSCNIFPFQLIVPLTLQPFKYAKLLVLLLVLCIPFSTYCATHFVTIQVCQSFGSFTPAICSLLKLLCRPLCNHCKCGMITN